MRAYSKEEIRSYNTDIQRLLLALPTMVDSRMLIDDIKKLAFTKCSYCNDYGKQHIKCGWTGFMECQCDQCDGEAYKRIGNSIMEQQLDLFNINDNPHIVENVDRVYTNVWVHEVDLSGQLTIPWVKFRAIMIELINDTQDEVTKGEAIKLIREVFEQELWNKDGSINKVFIVAIDRAFENVKIDFDDHGNNSKQANVYIPNCEEITIIGKKGSC